MGHEGDEEEGSHEGHEGSAKGDEEEVSHEGDEGHEGDEEEGSHEGDEGHEGDEEEVSHEGDEGDEGHEEVKAMTTMEAMKAMKPAIMTMAHIRGDEPGVKGGKLCIADSATLGA